MAKNKKYGSNGLTGDQVCQKLEEIFAEREIWQNGSYKQSNLDLYNIIDRCSILYREISLMTEGKRKIVQEIDNALAAKGIRLRSGTSLVTKIVRYVFGDCGNRAFAYARVIRVAAAEKKESETMADFIASRGGIEKIRRNGQGQKASAFPDRAGLVDRAGRRLASAIPLLNGIKLVDEIQPYRDNGLSLAAVLLRKEPDGSGSIVYSCSSETVINTLLAVSERENITDSLSAAAAAEPAEAAKARAAVIQRVAT